MMSTVSVKELGKCGKVDSVKSIPSYYSTKSTKSFRNTPVGSVQSVEHDAKQAGELLDYLTANLSKLGEGHASFQSEFEMLTAMCMLKVRDPELVRALKDCGWTGNRYVVPSNAKWDVDKIIQALSNYYLKCTNVLPMSSENYFSIQTSTGRHRSAFDNISPFCPEIVVSAIKANGGELKQPFQHQIVGACMLADISGFSAYSGQMCSRGVTGLDELRSVTNGLLGHFVRTVYECGGDVIAFAGDALICTFENRQQSELEAHCCIRALVCACLLCKDESHHLSTHVAVSYGNMNLALLGGLHDQWTYLLTGECINDLADCIHEAGPKQVAANAACIAQVKNNPLMDFLVNIIPCNEEEKNFLVSLQNCDPIFLRKVLEPMRRLAKPSEEVASAYDKIVHGEEAVLNTLHAPSPTRENEERSKIAMALIKFVPKPVKHALRGDILDSIGELRQVTTVFLSLDSYHKDVHGPHPLLLQDFFSRAQRHLQVSGGFLRQFLVDDKGCVLIAMWGVPSFSYANNCSRALYFAVALQRDLEELQHLGSIGITTGMVFCGCVGAEARKDYVGIGTDVNIAARLMSKAKGRILVDTATYQNLNRPTKELLASVEQLQLKGMAEPITPYKYSSSDLPRLSEPDSLDSTHLLQKRVTSMIDSHLDSISNAEFDIGSEIEAMDMPKSALFVLGPAGSGKSMATNYFRMGAQKRGMKSIFLQIQSFHKGVPYSVVRMLLAELISAGEGSNGGEAQRKMLRWVIACAYPQYVESEIDQAVTALEQVLGRYGPATVPSHTRRPSRVRATSSDYDLKDDEDNCRPLSESSPFTLSPAGGEDRVKTRKNGESILCKVLQQLLSYSGPYAIILENGHLCDELSWKLVNALFSEHDLQLVALVTVLVKVNVAKKEHPGTLYKRDLRRGSLHASQTMDLDEILGTISKASSTADTTPGSLTKGMSGTDALTERSPSENHAVLSDGVPRLRPAESESLETPGSEPAVSRSRITRKLESELPPGCLALMSRRFSDVLELGGLNKDEVRETLTASLRVASVSDSLVQMVMDVSSGNPFWCNAIASFIKDRGLKELEEARKKSETDSHAILRMLVVCRLDHLSVDELIVLKHASIIGEDFSYKLLQSIIPHKVFKNLDKHTGNLVEQGFIRCIEEVPELKFCFANQWFQQTLYSLTLPTDAALVHQAIAECIEVSNHDHLQPFYPMLAFHYKHCGGQFRDMAFKFELKSADQAIAQGAFGEGLEFAASSLRLAQRITELQLLLDVLHAGLDDMSIALSPSGLAAEASFPALTAFAPIAPPATSSSSPPPLPPLAIPAVGISPRRFSLRCGAGDRLAQDYRALEASVRKAIAQKEKDKEVAALAALAERQAQGSAASTASSSSSSASSSATAHPPLSDEERKKLLLSTRTASLQLAWQPSYATRRREEKQAQLAVTQADDDEGAAHTLRTPTTTWSSRWLASFRLASTGSASTHAVSGGTSRSHSHSPPPSPISFEPLESGLRTSGDASTQQCCAIN